MMNKKAVSILSMCQKAGKAVTGEEMCVRTIASGEAVLVIIAGDASDNTKKKFTNKSEFYGVPAYIWGTRDIISDAIGKINRPTVVITDEGLGNSLKSILDSCGK